MNVSHKLKLIWWAPARNATRALSEILCHYEFFNYEVSVHADLRTIFHSHTCKIPLGLEDYDILLQVRNPYSRIVSSWHLDCYTTENGEDLHITKPFEEYVENIYKITNLHYEECLKIKVPKYIIRYESIEKDMLTLPFIDLSNTNVKVSWDRFIVNNGYMGEGVSNDTGFLKRSKNTNYADWQSYYTQHTADLVYKNYTNQFEAFNYNKDSWKK